MRDTNLDHFNEVRRKGTKEEKEKAKAKDSLTGDKLKGDDRRKRRREDQIDSRKEINSGGEDDRRGRGELGSRMTNFLKKNLEAMLDA